MTCRTVQSLVSPYLDQQLPGTQMLDIQSHLLQCPQCADECRAVQQVRLALRSLPTRIPRQTLEARMVMDAARPSLYFSPAETRKSRRGKRLGRALALSCMALLGLSVRGAFDGLPHHAVIRHTAAAPGTMFVMEQTASTLPAATFVRVSPLPQSALPQSALPLPAPLTVAAPSRTSPPSAIWASADPLQTRFAGGENLTFAGYHSR